MYEIQTIKPLLEAGKFTLTINKETHLLNVKFVILTLSCIYCSDHRSAIYSINKNNYTKSHFDKEVMYEMDVYELISIAGYDKAMPNVEYR